MEESISVERCVGNMAKTCIDEWSTKPAGEGSGRTVFKASLTEGKRKEGISMNLLQHVWTLLSSMPCWDADEVAKPWTQHVTYDIPPTFLEKDVPALHHDLSTTLQCDAKGNDAQLVVAYQPSPPLQLGIGPTFGHIDVRLEHECALRNYLKSDATFHKISVDVKKTLTFREHFDWEYTFVLRYREPYHELQLHDPDDHYNDNIDKDFIFRDPPLCFFEISCHGLKQATDHLYFADSFLCKMTDVLPPAWKTTPLYVKQSQHLKAKKAAVSS